MAGLLLCLVCAAVGILWHAKSIKKTETDSAPQTDVILAPDTETVTETEQSYDPIAGIEDVNIPNSTDTKTYDYYEYAKNYATSAYLGSLGYKLTEQSYDPESCKVGYVSLGFTPPADFSQTTRKTEKAVTAEGSKGGYETKTETVTEDCPVLVPYYGYIIYNTGSTCMLLDNKGNTIISDFKGYSPAYMTDYCGNPLFEKDGKYYFYYNGKDYKGTAYTEIDKEDYEKLSADLPSAYKYFAYDVDMLNNLFVTNDFKNEANMSGIVYILPDYAGMVEFAVGEDMLYDLTVPSASYNRQEGELFRFPGYTYTKKEEKKVDGKPYYSYEVTEVLWGYMDAKGNVVIEPKYKKAYNFSKDGFAVVEDKHGHLCVINKWGSVVYNYYETIHYFPEFGNQKVRDGHYMPDTFGAENTGMLWFDQGYVRMRRKLVDTENGYIVKRETQTVVDTQGNTVNIPNDCTLAGYSDGVMLLQKGDKYGYMNVDGSWLIEPVLAYAKPFSEGLAVIGYAKDKLGVIDTEGNTVLYTMYQHIEDCSGGVITAYSNVGGWTVYNKMTTDTAGTQVINPIIKLKQIAIAQAKAEYYKQEVVNSELQSIKD